MIRFRSHFVCERSLKGAHEHSRWRRCFLSRRCVVYYCTRVWSLGLIIIAILRILRQCRLLLLSSLQIKKIGNEKKKTVFCGFARLRSSACWACCTFPRNYCSLTADSFLLFEMAGFCAMELFQVVMVGIEQRAFVALVSMILLAAGNAAAGHGSAIMRWYL